MKDLLLLLFSVLLVATAQGHHFSHLGVKVLDNLGLDALTTGTTAFWKSWFDEFTEKAEDGHACKRDGFFPSPGSCQAFFRCYWDNSTLTFKKYDFTCAPGTLFDLHLQKCVHAQKAKTLLAKCPNSETEHRDRKPGNPGHVEDYSAGFETEHFCVYDLRMSYMNGSPDGVLKRIIGFNGQFPGPVLRCTRNKWMIIRVKNCIQDNDEPTSIHWHGIEQNLSPFYDGPESITQCPIIRNTSMIYRFQLFQSGTYWYHSHHSYQYVDGAWGFLLVKNTPREVYQNSYDDERLISVNDWNHLPARNLSVTYLTQGIFPATDSSLINARGSFNCSNIIQGQVCNTSLQAPAVIKVTKGKTYRFRILNSSAARTYNFSIDGHKMVAIETDGVDTVPSPAFDIVSTLPAQRYSLLVTMNQPACEYWIRISGEGPPAPGLLGLAVLQYENCTPATTGTGTSTIGVEDVGAAASPELPKPSPDSGAAQGRPHVQDIPWTDIASQGGVRPATPAQLRAFFPDELPCSDEIEDGQSDKVEQVRTPTTSPVDPNTAVVLDQMDCPPYDVVPGGGDAPTNVDQEVLIVAKDCPIPGSPSRQCMNGQPFTPGSTNSLPLLFQVIRGLPVNDSYRPIYAPVLGKVIRIIVNNHHQFPHPWHLHGHTFWVLGTGAALAGDYVPARDLPTLNFHGVRRDTTFTFGNSWAVMTFITDNPGTWFFHCHINWHLEAGLGATFIEATNVSQVVYARPPLQSYQTCRAVGVNI